LKKKESKSITELLCFIYQALSDKKAERIRVIRVTELIKITDYFVICSAESTTQVGAITDELVKMADEHGYRISGIEGTNNNLWVLVDFVDVVVHVFLEEVRLYYDLDGLWKDAEEINMQDVLSKRQISGMKKH